ncbi:M50 family metallopeptidase [Polyangium sp. 6x1]|uniref:M50 family metallopeptidase n=1 Tax=Polyangium sp. 6x1 TaxID=3042689 RepID=UPI0024829A8D|nr:M50 family metallopeptidase [Polyangium sp. 6x1]MDI1447679.1 M50 family metallopeptidase [Polyangium sp. 6x1]
MNRAGDRAQELMSDKSKPELELLIRSRPGSGDAGSGSSGGFVTKRYVANQVALTVRPRRIPEESYEVQAQSRKDRKLFYVIRQLEGDRYLFLNEEEYFLWQKMDGLHTLRDVATAYFLKFGSFDFRVIQRFLSRARENKLIVIPQTDLVRRSLADEPSSLRSQVLTRLHRLDLRLSNVDQRITALYQRVGPLFSRPAYALYGALLTVGVVALVQQAGRGSGAEVLHAGHMLLLPLFVLLHVATLVVHELSHALACKHFGREVKAFGFTFMNRLVPSVYADVTDMWMSTRKARMAVSFAGPLSGLLIGSTSAIVAWILPPGIPSSFFWFVAVTIVALALGNLYPCLFIESDGYHILSDWLRIPALRENSRRFLREKLRDQLRSKKTRPMTSDERAYFLYGVTSLVSVALVLATLVAVSAHRLTR